MKILLKVYFLLALGADLSVRIFGMGEIVKSEKDKTVFGNVFFWGFSVINEGAGILLYAVPAIWLTLRLRRKFSSEGPMCNKTHL
jgi:hypothetical protein